MPTLIPGNELDLNTQSIETDASGWSSLTNCSVAQSGAQFSDGSESLAVTATASGTAKAIFNAGSVPFPAATPGNTYQFFFNAFTASSGIVVASQGDWYNVTTFVSSLIGSGVTLVPSTWTWVSATGVCPATTTLFRPVPQFTATAASQVVYLDQIYFGAPTAFPASAYPPAAGVMPPPPWRQRFRPVVRLALPLAQPSAFADADFGADADAGELIAAASADLDPSAEADAGELIAVADVRHLG